VLGCWFATLMAAKSPASAGSFAKVLRAYETGGFTADDVLDELKKLLEEGVSRAELFAVLQHRDFLEPLPGAVHAEILALLHDGMKRAVAESVVFSDDEHADEVPPFKSVSAAPEEIPVPATAVPPVSPSADRPERIIETTDRSPSSPSSPASPSPPSL
jgi:hypothetical protein